MGNEFFFKIQCNYCKGIIYIPYISITRVGTLDKDYYCNDSCRIKSGNNFNIKQINYIN